MAKTAVSFFDEKGGIIPVPTDFGRWWQTVYEIHIEVNLPPDTRGRDCKVHVTTTDIDVTVKGDTVLQGKLFGIIRPDELVWTLEDGPIIYILLARSDPNMNKEIVWPYLMADKSYGLSALGLHETKKKLDLERFELENPGFDFSSAKLARCYDKVKPLPEDEDDE